MRQNVLDIKVKDSSDLKMSAVSVTAVYLTAMFITAVYVAAFSAVYVAVGWFGSAHNAGNGLKCILRQPYFFQFLGGSGVISP